MLLLLQIMGIASVIAFGAVLLVGPPYVPTLRKQIETALDLLELQPGETLLELGSGDGRVVRAAARRGLNVVGIELNPFLVVISWLVTIRYRKRVRIIWGSYWGTPWPRADGIFTFMLPKYMNKLDKQIVSWQKNKATTLVSFAFALPNRPPSSERDGVFLYKYPKP